MERFKNRLKAALDKDKFDSELNRRLGVAKITYKYQDLIDKLAKPCISYEEYIQKEIERDERRNQWIVKKRNDPNIVCCDVDVEDEKTVSTEKKKNQTLSSESDGILSSFENQRNKTAQIKVRFKSTD